MSINTTIRNLATLGDRLHAERTRLGWNREKMANYGGVSKASQRLYDANDRVPTVMYFLQLANAGADFNYLIHAERAGSVDVEYLHLTKESLASAFRLTCQLWKNEDGRVNSEEDAEELLVSLVSEIHKADAPGIDLAALAEATSIKGNDQ